MKRFIVATILAVMLGTVADAQAWWGWPFGGCGPWGNGWGNDWYGDAGFDFNMRVGGWGRGWGRDWDYYDPYWNDAYGFYPYGWGYGNYPYVQQMPVMPAAPATKASK